MLRCRFPIRISAWWPCTLFSRSSIKMLNNRVDNFLPCRVPLVTTKGKLQTFSLLQSTWDYNTIYSKNHRGTGIKWLSSDIVALYCVANWLVSWVELDRLTPFLLIVIQKYLSLRDWCKSFNLKWNWFRWPFTFCLKVPLKVFLTNLWQSYTAPDVDLPQEIQSWKQKRFDPFILLTSGHQKGLVLNFVSDR